MQALLETEHRKTVAPLRGPTGHEHNLIAEARLAWTDFRSFIQNIGAYQK